MDRAKARRRRDDTNVAARIDRLAVGVESPEDFVGGHLESARRALGLERIGDRDQLGACVVQIVTGRTEAASATTDQHGLQLIGLLGVCRSGDVHAAQQRGAGHGRRRVLQEIPAGGVLRIAHARISLDWDSRRGTDFQSVTH